MVMNVPKWICFRKERQAKRQESEAVEQVSQPARGKEREPRWGNSEIRAVRRNCTQIVDQAIIPALLAQFHLGFALSKATVE